VPDQAESGGGLIVAAVQLAITMGAAIGGAIFDASGAKGVFATSALFLLGAVLIVGFGFRARPALAAS
jgi:DHA1 family purine ribonucleoside efflux pump-like MFS transporter